MLFFKRELLQRHKDFLFCYGDNWHLFMFGCIVEVMKIVTTSLELFRAQNRFIRKNLCDPK